MINKLQKKTKNVPRPDPPIHKTPAKFPKDSLASWLDYIEGLHPENIKLGLDRVSKVFLRLVAKPTATTVITIAGTNGKGSTVSFLENILITAGYAVGAYTSPHLINFNERIRINNKNAADDVLIQAFEKVERARGDDTELTYFEFTTLAALVIFFENKTDLDVVLLEVGMGGRLDATNILDPDISIITTVDIDHVEWLGADRESIAREKAGILRQEVPVIYGDLDMPKAISDMTDKLQCPIYAYEKAFTYSHHETGWNWTSGGKTRSGLPYPVLLGEQQLKNAATGLMALALLQSTLPVSQQAIKSGLLAANVAGRFQVMSDNPQIIFDVAHNQQAIQQLADTVKKLKRPGRTLAVVGMLGDKAIEKSLLPMMEIVDEWFLADLSGENPDRGLTARSLMAIVTNMNIKKPLSTHDAPLSAYYAAREKVKSGDRLIVFGSFHTVGGILAEIQQQGRNDI